jgi:serine/threonine-protein kinase
VLFSAGWNGPLFSASADGGATPVAISTVDTASGELGHWWPDVLPGGTTALITVWMTATGINDSKIAALDLATGKHRIIMAGSAAKFLPSGHLLFFHAGGFQVVPFDPVAMRPTGDPAKVLPDATPLDPLGSRDNPTSISSAGTLVYMTGPLSPETQLAWASARSGFEPVPGSPKRWRELHLSPDGRRVVGSRVEAGVTNLWVQDLARTTEQRLDLQGSAFDGIWNPADGSLIFTAMRKGHFDPYRLAASEAVPKAIIDAPLDQHVQAVSRDGKRIGLFDTQPDGTIELVVAEIDRPTVRTRLPIVASSVGALEFSADGTWLAAQTTMSGRREIVVMSVSGTGAPVPITSGGGAAPHWSLTSPTLYFEREDALVAATYTTAGGRFTVTREDVLFKLAGHHLVGVAHDGRFLLSKPLPGQALGIQVAVNWLSELRK